MSNQQENSEHCVQEDSGKEKSKTGESTGGEPLGGEKQPGRLQEVRTIGVRTSSCQSDELETAKETGTQVDLPKNHKEQLQESQLEAVEEAQDDSPDDTGQFENETENAANSTATVKVLLVPEGHVMTVAFAIGLSIQELKHHLASELRVPAKVLQLSLDGRVVEEQQSLMELGVRPHSSMQMEMSSTDPNSHPLRLLRPTEHDSMPDVITVRVQKDGGSFMEVVVEIECSSQKKPFLGGYRHRLTGVEYHHAAVQTRPRQRPDRGVEVCSHQTQTVELKSQTQQSPVSVSTQMTAIGCYVQCVTDRLVSPGKYITADEVHDRRLKAVICLQSFARRWLAQQAVDRLRRQRKRRLDWLEMQERRWQEEKEEQLRDRRKRWMNPQRREDFNMMYHALEKWRTEEEQQINSALVGAERKAALCLLLEQEMDLIAAIGRHHIEVQAKNHDRIIKNFLNKSSASHRWRAADGRLLEMDTPNIIRARELQEVYNNISMKAFSKEQRRDFLTTLKHIVKEHDCELTRDIVNLVEREVDLMTRGVKERNLEGLRKRICTLFLQYIRNPAFNPNVAKLLKVPQNPSQLRRDVFRCRGCHRYLCSANFSSSPSGLCQHCTWLDNIARARNDFSLYRNILKRLRTDEQTLNKEAKIPSLLKVEDMHYLIETVWESRSAVSGSSDLYNLVFVRWDHQKDWSPWNCILLSKEETSAHLEFKDVNKAYKTTFIRSIIDKHTTARQHFSRMPTMAKYLECQPDTAPSDQFNHHHGSW